MEKDKTLETLFADFQPELGDNADFMASLNRKLDAVEYIKKVQDAQIRRYKYAVVAALVLGIISGGTLFAFVITMPDMSPLFTFDTHFLPLMFLQEHSRTLTLIALSLLVSFGIVTLITQIQNIREEFHPHSLGILKQVAQNSPTEKI